MNMLFSRVRLVFLALLALGFIELVGCGKPASEEKAGTAPANGISFTASPNPVSSTDGSHLGVTKLSWTASNSAKVEIHVGKPDGALLCKGNGTGSCDTAKWVTDGMTFYLQDSNASSPTDPSATLGSVKVTVQ